jgi:oxaloacetate decarboxylase alpha subunit
MSTDKKPLGITEVVFRDAHQSLFATRLRIDDMLPIAEKLDKVGFWSVESWGGATFDSCIRFLGEDPWERIRKLKAAMPNTRQQMLLRGQNLLGYRHYADDVVVKFVDRAAVSGVDVFRIFDAMNDVRNLKTAVEAVLQHPDKHAQGAISYTESPVHTIDMWVDLAKRVEDLGAHSIVIKDMSGLLKPYVASELVSKLKESLSVEVHLHCHATTGLSLATAIKAIDAGVDNLDTAISSMSMTYGHSPTETIVAALEGTDRDTGLDLKLLEEIAAYFREVRKKYHAFEGSLKGIDSRILVAQVPGGMLTNLESQLKQQGAENRFDEVLEEIPKVRKDLGYIPLVTPTSQIVGTQAVLNVLTGERYKTVTRETEGLLKGEYGAAPAQFNKELQARVLNGADPITCRPADNLKNELDDLTSELKKIASEKNIQLAKDEIDDVLIYSLFPQVGLKFLENRGNPDAFEPLPGEEVDAEQGEGVYTVTVNGKSFVAQVSEGGDISGIAQLDPEPSSKSSLSPPPPVASPVATEPLVSPLAGTILKINIKPGQAVQEESVVIVMEAMKMETEICAHSAGTVKNIFIKEGDTVAVGDALVEFV